MGDSPIFIRLLGLQDKSLLPEGTRILNVTQGIGLFAQDYLEKRIEEPESQVLGAFDREKLIGIAIAQMINEFSFYLPFDPEIEKKLSGKKVGSFSTLCFLDEYRGLGLGQKMSHHRLAWLNQKDCDVIVGVSWVSGLAHTSDRVFVKMGFEKVKRVENFFYQSSIEKPFVCPGCGEPPCTCPAEFFMRYLK